MLCLQFNLKQKKVQLENKDDLSTAYTPGVAEPCREIHKNPADAYKYTLKANTVAVVSDGTAVLGLGDIGPLAAIPVMEGKSVLFKKFDIAHALEGDGKAKFGFGTYVTESYTSAAHYAYNKKRPENKDYFVYTLEIPNMTEDNAR